MLNTLLKIISFNSLLENSLLRFFLFSAISLKNKYIIFRIARFFTKFKIYRRYYDPKIETHPAYSPFMQLPIILHERCQPLILIAASGRCHWRQRWRCQVLARARTIIKRWWLERPIKKLSFFKYIYIYPRVSILLGVFSHVQ